MKVLTREEFYKLPEPMRKAYTRKVNSIARTYQIYLLKDPEEFKKRPRKVNLSIFEQVEDYLDSN